MKDNHDYMLKRLIILLQLFLVASTALWAQGKKLEASEIVHESSYSKEHFPKDKKGEYYNSVAIEVMLNVPNAEFIGDDIIPNATTTITGGYIIFVKIPKKDVTRKFSIRTPEYQPLTVVYHPKQIFNSFELYNMTVTPVEQDQNAGKAWLDFTSRNAQDFTVTVKGQNYGHSFEFTGKNGKTSRTNLPYDTYTYTVHADTYFDYEGQVTLTGEPVTESFTMKTIEGNLTIKREPGVILLVDGKEVSNATLKVHAGEIHTVIAKWGPYLKSETVLVPSEGTTIDMRLKGSLLVATNAKNGTVTLKPVNGTVPDGETWTVGGRIPNLLGTYDVTVNKSGMYSQTKRVEVKANEKKDINISLVRIVDTYGFISYVYSPKAPFGLMFGSVTHWGWYGKAQFAAPSWKVYSAADQNNEDGRDLNGAMPIADLTKEKPENLDEYGNFRFSITGGAMYRLSHFAFVYAGLGYGSYSNIYEDTNENHWSSASGDDGSYNKYRFYEGVQCKGMEAEAGLIIKLGNFNIIGGYGYLVGSKSPFADLHVGAGYIF